MALVLFTSAAERAELRRRRFVSAAQQAESQVTELARQPARFVSSLSTLIGAEGGNGLAQVGGPNAVNQYLTYGRSISPAPTRSVIQIRRNDNRNRLNQTIRLLAMTAKATTLIDNVPESYDEILRERDGLVDQFDQELLTIDDSELYTSITDLRAAFVTDMTEKARTRPQLEEVPVRGINNVLSVAYELYEDTNRADEIVGRNNITTPGLLENDSLLVLST